MPNTNCLLTYGMVACVALAQASWLGESKAATLSNESCRTVPVLQKKEIVCRTNFYRLNASVEVNKRYVEITGYLHKSLSGYYLFASKDAYVYSAGRDGVYLEVDADQARGFDAEFDNYEGPVTITGLFSRDRRGGASESLGRVKVLGSMFWRQELPGEKPSLPKK
ncbi:hypothetical protein [Pseudomonas sp. CGJS7]|uniref:hypothetical protein n=1 Tax=Pseudomonas sp. CGJS7 TaxID=3109348 RepID=UPI00300B0153